MFDDMEDELAEINKKLDEVEMQLSMTSEGIESVELELKALEIELEDESPHPPENFRDRSNGE